MKNFLIAGLVLIIFTGCSSGEQEITPVPFNKVGLDDGFWKTRMQTELAVTVPFSVEQCALAVERFRCCAAYLRGEDVELPKAPRYISSDLYKVMEGVAYSLMAQPNEELEEFMDSTIALIGQTQREDGYLYIPHIFKNQTDRSTGDRPYSLLSDSHELYNVGHLYEAALAYYQATGKRELLDIAIKSAKHVNHVIFEGDPNYNDGKPVMQAPGHEEIELALCKLYRVTGDRLYLDMAKRFLEIRGVTFIPETRADYAQQHKPVAEQTEAVGHAVRAAYLYTGMAQVDALTGLHDYDFALNSIWNNIVSTRLHITGGLGSMRAGESFGAEYYLPNKEAYNETCAAVANVFFNQGMFLRGGDAKYLDVAEVSMFNNALAGISLSGDRFFYVNPLEADGTTLFDNNSAGRSEWFNTACCPPNISRMILQTPGYMYAYGKDKIYLTLYGGSHTSIPLKKGEVSIAQKSDYPFDGHVRVTLSPKREMEIALCLRIPTWCSGNEFLPGGLYPYKDGIAPEIEVKVNGEDCDYVMESGFAVVSRKWKEGDVLELNLPMPVRYVGCDPRVEANVGATAVTRGPLVYCAEEVDNGVVQRLRLTDDGTASYTEISEGPLSGLTSVNVPGKHIDINGVATSKEIVMVPYYSWCNRGDNQSMMVWLNND